MHASTPPDTQISEVFPGSGITLLRPRTGAPDLVSWMGGNLPFVRELLAERGALLLRGYAAEPVTGLEAVLGLLSSNILTYTNQSTPRTRVDGKVYTTTEYPPGQTIPQHCEMAYQRDWPTLLAFQCVQPAVSGGETPLADVQRITERIGPDVLRRFEERGVLYVRNYGQGVDLPWQQVFQTDEPAQVEAFCKDAGMEYEWLGADRLRTRHHCQGCAPHPLTGRKLWFNQAHLFHISALPAELQEAMLGLFGEDGLPRNAFFGDGGPIDPADLEQVRAAFDAETRTFPWQAGDLTLVDNMRFSHGRTPFTGPRKVLVAMSDPYSEVMAALGGAQRLGTSAPIPSVTGAAS